jgi:hypothetical protein
MNNSEPTTIPTMAPGLNVSGWYGRLVDDVFDDDKLVDVEFSIDDEVVSNNLNILEWVHRTMSK